MTDNELLLQDRIEKIRQVISKYGEKTFYLSFSGGKDSTVLSWLIDYALPNNTIPRVYVNTGIELNMVRDFVIEMKKHDDRVVIMQSNVPIKPMLENEGYPFKSKFHSKAVWEWQKGKGDNVLCTEYRTRTSIWNARKCPKKLLYQFDGEWNAIKISDKCCDRLKKDTLHKYAKETGRKNAIIGIMPAEGGRREKAVCLAFKGKKLNFQPLVPVTKEWEDWLIERYNIKISDIYKPPYNFERTGCKGCPFALNLQKELDTLEKFFPNERKQCEIIWKPVYDEYRRIGYRLKPISKYKQLTLFDIMEQKGE